jgi:hypothetical protein
LWLLPACAPPDGTGVFDCTWNVADTEGSPLVDVWGFSANDVYAVGSHEYYNGEPDGPAGFVKHWDGGALSGAYVHEVPSRFSAIWGSSPADLYVAGTAFHDGDNSGILLHGDGQSWSVVSESAGTEFRALWGSDASGVYAAGSSADRTAIVRFWDGDAWSLSLEVQELSEFVDVWGRDADDVYALGTTNPQQEGKASRVFRFDGANWSEIPSELPVRMLAISGDDAGGLYVTGGHWVGPSTVHYFDGSGWDLSYTATDSACLADVLALAPDRVMVTGGCRNGHPGSVVLLGDGESWEMDPYDAPILEFNYSAMWSASPLDVVFVGSGNLWYGAFTTLTCTEQ